MLSPVVSPTAVHIMHHACQAGQRQAEAEATCIPAFDFQRAAAQPEICSCLWLSRLSGYLALTGFAWTWTSQIVAHTAREARREAARRAQLAVGGS
jgi:hypothetical protein